ncbi:MAG: type II secretion system protein [Spirochaetales bacterium]|nr:type II secretion system protein [Spirochaetales bacterium]
MRRRLNLFNRKQKRDSEGFTLLETLVAITLIAILGALLFPVFMNALSLIERVKNLNTWSRTLLTLEQHLRDKVGRIEYPYWGKNRAFEILDETVRIPYWDGKKDACLTIRLTGGTLVIESPGEARSFPGISEIGFSPLLMKESQSAGLSITIIHGKNEPVTIQCTFANRDWRSY